MFCPSNGKKLMMGVHHMMGIHHILHVPFLFLQSECESLAPFGFWQGSLDLLRQRIRMSIEYDMQKINLAVIIIVNFHKFNFECFWLDNGGTST